MSIPTQGQAAGEGERERRRRERQVPACALPGPPGNTRRTVTEYVKRYRACWAKYAMT